MTAVELIEELIKAGVPARVVAEVAILARDAEKLSSRRKADAARQRNFETGKPKQSHVSSRDLTLSHATSREQERKVFRLSKERTSQVPSEPSTSRSQKRSLPIDFQLSEAGIQFAIDRGWDQLKVKTEFERFCDHAAGNDRRQADWQAAWRNWVTSPYQHAKPNGYNGHAKPSPLIEAADRAVADANRRLADISGEGGLFD